MAQKLYRGQGKLFMQKKIAGVYGPAKFAGNVTALTLSPQSEKIEHRESTSGKNAIDKVIYRDSKVGFSATFENFEASVLADAFQGAVTDKALGTVTGEELPEGETVVGGFVFLAQPQVSTLVITDSAGTPATLVAGTHYEIESAAHGSVKILDLDTFVLPLVASYAHGASSSVSIMSETAADYRFRFEGLNSADDDSAVIVTLEASMAPASQLALIGDDFGSYEMAGDCLYKNGSFANVKQVG